jgi:hypothetical protein
MSKSKATKTKVATIAAETAPAAKRGRPVVAESKRQARLVARQAKIEAGVEVKRGRPKKTA